METVTTPVDTTTQILPASHIQSPYHINIPVNALPTEELIKRLTIWRKILKQLIYYFKETSLVKEYNSKINTQMLKSVQFPSNQGNNLSFNIKTASANKVNKLGAKIAASKHGLGQVANNATSKPNPTVAGEKGHSRNKSGGSLVNLMMSERNASTSTLASEPCLPLGAPTSPETPLNNDFKIPDTYFTSQGAGGIMDLSSILSNYHKNLNVKEQQTAVQLVTKVIPRLENLRKDLVVKIKEIRSITPKDFKVTSLKTEVAITGKLLAQFIKSIQYFSNEYGLGIATRSVSVDEYQYSPKDDPYLLKLRLELQLRKQLIEENYIKENFVSLQSAGEQLDKIIFKEISNALNKYSVCLCQEMDSPVNHLLKELKTTILSKPANFEWENFIMQNPQHFMVAAQVHPRKLSSILYPHKEVFLNKCIRSGYLLKKNKILKNYATNFYVLTPNFIHEFKTPDRKNDPYPTMSLNLSDIIVANLNQSLGKFSINVTVSSSSKSKSTMVLASGATSAITKTSFVFKCTDPVDLAKWFNDLNNLTSFDSIEERFGYVESKLMVKNKTFTQSDHILQQTPIAEERNMFEDVGKTKELLGKLGLGSKTAETPKRVLESSSNSGFSLSNLNYQFGGNKNLDQDGLSVVGIQSHPLSPMISPNIERVFERNPFDTSFNPVEDSEILAKDNEVESPVWSIDSTPKSGGVSPVCDLSASQDLTSQLMMQQQQAIIQYHQQQLEQMQRTSQKIHQQQVQPQAVARAVSPRPGFSPTENVFSFIQQPVQAASRGGSHQSVHHRSTSSGSVVSNLSDGLGFSFGPKVTTPPVAGATNTIFLNPKHNMSTGSVISATQASQIKHVLHGGTGSTGDVGGASNIGAVLQGFVTEAHSSEGTSPEGGFPEIPSVTVTPYH
ncbi:hypothetical protein BABINDRAFT_161636 [Babjeviella inositovora NRRL Y-12698]|uniref:PH domain-containing protein n=1 Tax=Babjeviella inositovora NRRL Y-12698 TaxID=984486 RepID=A0A1E3QSI5_9ASCO|nr:uncharacterized protein BABINDRAFT_161636 [Babjeviella inositovora NRRL Y-12698]ODQ79982.1 hypothetical protein BABINDRAFT_161636 [Babjeviella inositovora NRRL Y-12698]